MKVLQVLPELHSGGVERGTLEMARHLVRTGHQSLVLSHGGRLVSQLEKEGSTHLTRPVHQKSLLSLRHVRSLRKLLEHHQPDILHLRSRAPAWLCYLAWKSLPPSNRPRLITTVHGFYSVNLYSRIMTMGEEVICVSDSVRDYVLKNYPKTPSEKLTVIHRGVDGEDYNPDFLPSTKWAVEWQNKHQNLIGKKLVTLPGRVTRWKGHDDFLALISLLKKSPLPVHGLIAGDAHARKQSYWLELQEKVKELALGDDITFLGHRSDLREVLSQSDLVVSLSKDPEAFGRVSLEALALGKPVVGYHHGGVAEQLDAMFPQGSVDPLDISGAARKVESLLQSQENRPSPLPDQFQLTHMTSRTLQVYEKALT